MDMPLGSTLGPVTVKPFGSLVVVSRVDDPG